MSLMLSRRKYVVSGPTGSHAIAITFDDGPHPVHTPEVLDVLRRRRAFATFFLVGRAAEAHPDLVRRILDEGHEIGNHTWSHVDAHRVDAATYDADVERGAEALDRLAGRSCSLFRPPFGRLRSGQFLRAWNKRRTVVLWNADPKDYKVSSPEDYLRRIANFQVRSGDVVLLHDKTSFCAAGTDALLNAAERVGVVSKTVSALCGLGGNTC